MIRNESFNLFTLEMLRARSRAKIYVTFEKAHLFFKLSKQNIYTETKLYAKNFLSSTVVPLCHLFLNKRVISYTRMIYRSLKRISFSNEIQCFTVTNTQNHTFVLRAIKKKVVFSFHLVKIKCNWTSNVIFQKKEWSKKCFISWSHFRTGLKKYSLCRSRFMDR